MSTQGGIRDSRERQSGTQDTDKGKHPGPRTQMKKITGQQMKGRQGNRRWPLLSD